MNSFARVPGGGHGRVVVRDADEDVVRLAPGGVEDVAGGFGGVLHLGLAGSAGLEGFVDGAVVARVVSV